MWSSVLLIFLWYGIVCLCLSGMEFWRSIWFVGCCHVLLYVCLMSVSVLLIFVFFYMLFLSVCVLFFVGFYIILFGFGFRC